MLKVVEGDYVNVSIFLNTLLVDSFSGELAAEDKGRYLKMKDGGRHYITTSIKDRFFYGQKFSCSDKTVVCLEAKFKSNPFPQELFTKEIGCKDNQFSSDYEGCIVEFESLGVCYVDQYFAERKLISVLSYESGIVTQDLISDEFKFVKVLACPTEATRQIVMAAVFERDTTIVDKLFKSKRLCSNFPTAHEQRAKSVEIKEEKEIEHLESVLELIESSVNNGAFGVHVKNDNVLYSRVLGLKYFLCDRGYQVKDSEKSVFIGWGG